ncbi:hypothetical protein N7467_011034 [Penicillium canescens]|nr:hypothetical protein N7467_011034 [Penicillium canescens]
MKLVQSGAPVRREPLAHPTDPIYIYIHFYIYISIYIMGHASCPKCGAATDGAGKSCGSCGATCPV